MNESRPQSNVISLFGKEPIVTRGSSNYRSHELIDAVGKYAGSAYTGKLREQAKKLREEKLPEDGFDFDMHDADAMEEAVDTYITRQLAQEVATHALLRRTLDLNYPRLLNVHSGQEADANE